MVVKEASMRMSSITFPERRIGDVISAFVVDDQIIFAHEVIDDKSNEIPGDDGADIVGSRRECRLQLRGPATSFEIDLQTGNDLIVEVKSIQLWLAPWLNAVVTERRRSKPMTAAILREIARRIGALKSRPLESSLAGTAWLMLVAAVIRITRQTLIHSSASRL